MLREINLVGCFYIDIIDYTSLPPISEVNRFNGPTHRPRTNPTTGPAIAAITAPASPPVPAAISLGASRLLQYLARRRRTNSSSTSKPTSSSFRSASNSLASFPSRRGGDSRLRRHMTMPTPNSLPLARSMAKNLLAASLHALPPSRHGQDRSSLDRPTPP
jgi:hypothetical protein